MSKENKPTKVTESDIVNSVLKKIDEFKAYGELRLPHGYVVENALKSAYLTLLETKTKDDKPVLEVCTKHSIANALLDMCVQGLSPMKKQCDFIAYGNKLTLVREYHGTVALAKRYGGVKSVYANIIYENDEFQYEIDGKTGLKKIVNHEQDFENIDNNKIRGAYAVLSLEDGSSFVEIMNIKQIRTSWQQGAMKGNSPAHQKFPDEMAKKTVINRACKLFISTSSDEGIYEEEEVEKRTASDNIDNEVKENANKEEMTIDDAEEVVVIEKEEEKETENIEKDKTTEPQTNQQATIGPGF